MPVFLTVLFRDARYALRGFARNPVFTVVALLSLGLGIGSNTAIFSLLDRVLLRELPVRAPQELVQLTSTGPRSGNVVTNYDSDFTFSYPMYRDFRDRAPLLAGVMAWYPVPASFSVGGQTELVQTNLVSGNFFDVLGVKSIFGRTIVPEDALVRGSGPVVVLSHGFWTRRFAADPSILNQKVMVNGHPMTIVGVAAKNFLGVAVGEAPALFVPVSMEGEMMPGRNELEKRRSVWLNMIARLKPGVTRASAESALNTFWRPILEEEGKNFSQSKFRERFVNSPLTLVPAAGGISSVRGSFGGALTVVMALVGLVLLIACANVANLLLARAAGRRKEIAIRLALGAGRKNIVRQILTESALLSLAGGALGVLLASWTGGLLIRLVPLTGFNEAIPADPDMRVLLFAAGVSILSGLLFGLAPALQASRGEVYATLKDQAANTSAGVGQVRTRKVLVAAQVALSLLLLIGAGLFLRTLQNLQAIDPGFRADRLIAFSVDPSLNAYKKDGIIALFDRLTERLAGLPGVRGAALTQTALLTGNNWVSSITIPGRERKETDPTPNVDSISADYFSTLGTPLLAGREFSHADGSSARRVAIVNETFRRIFYDDADPLGRQFYDSSDSKKERPIEIVGVVKDSKYADLREKKPAFIFVPYSQRLLMGPGTYYVRTTQDPASIIAALRQAVGELDASLPLFDVKTMQQQIDESVFTERMVSLLSAFFGVLATLLASIGLYGVMAYMVTRRTREIGVRMALGASRGSVLKLVLAEVLMVVGVGVAIALVAAIPLGRVAQSMLFGVSPNDPLVLAGATVLLIVVAALAGYVPAARATRVDPLTALRHD